MKLEKNLLTRAAQHLELPLDVVTGAPRIEIIGTEEFGMEPHNGLVAYDQTEILIKTGHRIVAVQGDRLIVKLMNDRRIVINGNIAAVHLQEAAGE